MLAWLDYAWVIEMFNVLVRNKIRTRHLPPPPFLTLLGLRCTLIFMDGPLFDCCISLVEVHQLHRGIVYYETVRIISTACANAFVYVCRHALLCM